MKAINLFTSNLEGKALRMEKSESKKAVNRALAEFTTAIDGAFAQVIKSPEKRARNVANAAKGKYRSAIAVVQACYPYQTEDGELLRRVKNADGVRVWDTKKLTAAAARGIVRDALKHFTDTIGQPCPTIGIVGEPCEASK